MHRASAALGLALIVAGATSCGGGDAAFRATAPTTVRSVPETTPETTIAPSTSVTTAATPTTTRPSTTTSRPTSTTPTTVPQGRPVPVGVVFSVTVGEVATVDGGMTVTFTAVVSDSRCRPGRQCIVAGNAIVSVRATQPGLPPADMVFDTDKPAAARYGPRSVELVDLSFGQPPVARLKVT